MMKNIDWKGTLLSSIQNTVAEDNLVQDCGVSYDESLHKLNVVVTYNQYFTEEMVNQVKNKILGLGSWKYIEPWYGAVHDDECEFVDIQLKFEHVHLLGNKTEET